MAVILALASLAVTACGDDDGGGSATGSGGGSTSEELESAKMEMDFLFYGNHAPFALALEDGYYADEGIDMTLQPGQGSTTTIQSVRTGKVNVGYVSPLSLIQAKAQDPSLDVVVVAQIMQHAPWVAAYVKGGDISTPADMAGKTWAGTPGGPDAAWYESYMKENGYEVGKFVALDDTYRALLGGQVDVAPAPITSYPALEDAAKQAGKQVAYFPLAEGDVDHYNWALTASQGSIEEQPELIRGIVAASLKGWRQAMVDPDAAVAAMAKLNPEQDPATTKAQLDVSLELAQSADTCTKGLGYSNPEMWQQTVDLAMDRLDIKGEAPDPTSLYTNDFLPKDPITPPDC